MCEAISPGAKENAVRWRRLGLSANFRKFCFPHSSHFQVYLIVFNLKYFSEIHQENPSFYLLHFCDLPLCNDVTMQYLFFLFFSMDFHFEWYCENIHQTTVSLTCNTVLKCTWMYSKYTYICTLFIYPFLLCLCAAATTTSPIWG